jgi:Cdc6-like AAA superfamily ATPase
MNWIVLGEKNNQIQLVSKDGVGGLLPKGSFLTVEDGDVRFVLRVEDSAQTEPYKPSPLIVDMDLGPLIQDRKCKNIITAYRICDLTERGDGLIDFIRPQSVARQSTQEEIDQALGLSSIGPRVFIASVQYNQNQILTDNKGNMVSVQLPRDMFFHQMLVCGKTGSGKTVALKYLAQYFIEELEGAVLAVNVKDIDLLRFDKPSQAPTSSVLKEWAALKLKPRGVKNFRVYYPANAPPTRAGGVELDLCEKIALDVKRLDPESLVGLLQSISDIGAAHLPAVFRAWQTERTELKKKFTFADFVNEFQQRTDAGGAFDAMTLRGIKTSVTLAKATCNNILRNLNVAIDFFDDSDAKVLSEEDILVHGKLSVIDVAKPNAKLFGSVMLRHLLHQIVHAKTEKRYEVPVLIIIDEVHNFYNTDASNEALGDLDTICRMGRSLEIGVIFASQDPKDMPRGLSSVINTQIFFKSEGASLKHLAAGLSPQELENLKKGFAVASIHNLPQVRIIKFPLALAGVID